jgi:3-keto-5-aminohexanoate cleavage enzyme
MDKLIITVAVCGAEVTKQHTPYIPVTPEEIVQQSYEAFLEGASIVHLHVRDENGNPTQNDGDIQKSCNDDKREMPWYDCSSFNWWSCMDDC